MIPNWLDRLPPAPVTRFAPSPTGELHLGHVANAVWTWGVARAVHGTVLLRIEDHDRGRSRRAFESQLLVDLEWLGCTPDGACLDSLHAAGPSPWRQSDCDSEYRQALARLGTATQVYGCRCSRSQIARSVDMGHHTPGQELRYPGTCRQSGLAPDAPGVGARAILPDEPVGFDDALRGRQVQVPVQQCGDVLIRDALGNWTYQFAVAVDDLRQGVTLVVRGDDLLGSSGRQILLGRLLGRSVPVRFLHHPLILDATGAKLSKRDGAVSLRAMRDAGQTAKMVLDRAADATAFPVELRWW